MFVMLYLIINVGYHLYIYTNQGFIQDFYQRGGIVASSNMIKLGDLGAYSPRKMILKLKTSKTVSGGF